MKKGLLTAAILICLIVVSSKIVKFVQSRIPPFAVGECFMVNDPAIGPVKFEVESNDRIEGSTIAIGRIEWLPGLEARVPVKVTFDEIRQSQPRKTDCL